MNVGVWQNLTHEFKCIHCEIGKPTQLWHCATTYGLWTLPYTDTDHSIWVHDILIYVKVMGWTWIKRSPFHFVWADFSVEITGVNNRNVAYIHRLLTYGLQNYQCTFLYFLVSCFETYPFMAICWFILKSSSEIAQLRAKWANFHLCDLETGRITMPDMLQRDTETGVIVLKPKWGPNWRL